jgi:hypothetical protein
MSGTRHKVSMHRDAESRPDKCVVSKTAFFTVAVLEELKTSHIKHGPVNKNHIFYSDPCVLHVRPTIS